MGNFLSNYGDITECILQSCIVAICFSGKTEEKALENTDMLNFRLSIALIVKFFVYFYSIPFFSQDYEEFMTFEFIMTLIVWVIQDLYLLFIERDYILYGENDLMYRFTWFKLIDLIQNLFLFIQFAVALFYYKDTTIYRILFFIYIIYDLISNFIELVWQKKKRFKKQKKSYKDQHESLGGNYILYFFTFMGGFLAFDLIISIRGSIQEGQETQFPFTSDYLYACYIGILAMIGYTTIELFECLFMAMCCCQVCCSSCSKTVLMIFYGLGFGIGSMLFAPVFLVVCPLMFLNKLRCKCKRTKRDGRTIVPTEEA